jgi:hypothetical protein
LGNVSFAKNGHATHWYNIMLLVQPLGSQLPDLACAVFGLNKIEVTQFRE